MMKQYLLAAAALVFVPAAIAGAKSTTVHHGTTTINDRGQVIRHGGDPIVQGSGRIVWQQRAVGRFNRIELTGVGNVEVQLGAAQSVAIAADDNLHPYLTSEVRGDTLVIGSRGSFSTTSSPKIRITVPDLASLTATGSGNIDFANVANRRLEVTLRGSGNLTARGRTSELDLKMQGSGNADLRTLAATNAKVGLYGSGNATVRASQHLEARSYGSGVIRYLGDPKHVNVHSAGSGRIIAGN